MAEVTRLLSSYNSRKGQNRPKYVIFHTNGGSTTSTPANLINYIEGQLAAGNASVTQPHHITGMNGDDYTTLLDDAKGVASYKAEGMCISVETQDSGYNNVPLNNDPWTPAQFEANAKIAARASIAHGIPLRLPTHPLNDTGIGWHAMWGYNTYSEIPGTYGTITVGGRKIALNNPWTTVVGKVCPGQARINQMNALIERAKQLVGVAGDDDMLKLIQDSSGVFVTNDMVTYRAVSPDDINFMARCGFVQVLSNGAAKVYDELEEGLPAGAKARMTDLSPGAVQARMDWIVNEVAKRIPPSGGISQAQIDAIIAGVIAGLPKNGTFKLS